MNCVRRHSSAQLTMTLSAWRGGTSTRVPPTT
uniref:Uncharacterized protein n=1 Tax=Arundo donax TaxID=35708 RepID=A0A0A8ZL30_ARUDO